MSFNYFQNKECEYFPCHKVNEKEKGSFNCLFCFCPLYNMNDCGGCYKRLNNGLKDCTACMIPHFNYDFIINKLIKENKNSTSHIKNGC